tara:strand:- start:1208 stop:1855 length:648 start_codon:yes stop_codon:yes gene_type:complete
MSGEPAGHGWVLGIGMLLIYGTLLFVIWGAIQAIAQRNPLVFLKPIEQINHLAAKVAMICIPIMAVSIVYEVICRYALNSPTIWAFEVSYMLMGVSLLLGIGYCAQLRKHIRVDFLYDNLSLKKQSLLDGAGYIFLLIPASVLLTWGLFEYWIEAYKVNERTGESAWNPLVWPFKFFFAFGFYLFTLQIISELVKCLMRAMGRDVPEPDMPKGFE